MREFKVLDSAASAEQLKKRIRSEEYEKYGEPFTPEFVYDAIRTLPRFASMRVSLVYHRKSRDVTLTGVIAWSSTRCPRVPRVPPRRSS